MNFGGAPKFMLPSESNRPVYVPSSSIVPKTGSASAVESRESAAFGRGPDRVSDLRGDARQTTVYGIPNIPFRVGILTVGYTYSDARGESRGSDGSAARDPRSIEWSSQAFTPRHQVVLQATRVFFGGAVGVTAAGRVQSGLRYTPFVSGDINGDGATNDRAFISTRRPLVTPGWPADCAIY